MTLIDARPRADTTPGATPMFVPTDLLMVLMVAIWGFNFPVVKYATRQMSPLAFNATRISLAAVVLLAFARATVRVWPTRRQVLLLLALGVLGNGIYQMVFVGSVVNTDVGVAALLLASSPAFIALLSRFAGLGPISSRCAIGIALSLAGVALIALTSRTAIDGTSSLEGNLLSVLAAMIWAVYVVLQARYVNDVEDTAVAALTLAGGVIPLLIFGAHSMLATKWSALPVDVWLGILWGGVISLALASVFWYRGVRILGATRTGIYLHLEPVFALIAAWIWMHEHPTPLQGVGALTILAGVTLTHT
ncbi:MAG: DMT family transporter [Gemmatimonadota bacterium]